LNKNTEKENINSLGQIVGARVDNWLAPKFPTHEAMQGQHCIVAPLDITQHSNSLFESYQEDSHGRLWTYLPYGPFNSVSEYKALFEKLMQKTDQQFYAVIDLKTKRAVGVVGYLRINPAAGSIEVGHISYSPLLQRTIMATEAMFLMMQTIFAAGYRRYEWKCNSLNEASKASALRLGFQFEGIFRQALVLDGRNRDTAWYSIIDSEWLALKAMFEGWLSESNFDDHGQQYKKLTAFLK